MRVVLCGRRSAPAQLTLAASSQAVDIYFYSVSLMESVCFRKFLCRHNSFKTVYINVKISFFICFPYSGSNNHLLYLLKFIENIFLFTLPYLLDNYLLGILNCIPFKSFGINFHIYNVSKFYSSFQ